jgi:hypothetical protein
MTIVAAGNGGSSCSTVNAPPAIYDAAYTVGATSSSDTILGFSSRGPVSIDDSGRLKPDITAPGADIRSSKRGGNYVGYQQGTSMSSPHVAGAVALIWSAQPALRNRVDETKEILNATAVPRTSTQCGDAPDSVPNSVYGWGRLDALAAVDLALDYALCTPVLGVDFGCSPPAPTMGHAAAFSATVTAGSQPITYTWDFGDGSLGDNGPVVTHTFTTTPTNSVYTVTLTATNGCPSLGVKEKQIAVLLHALYLPVILRDYRP